MTAFRQPTSSIDFRPTLLPLVEAGGGGGNMAAAAAEYDDGCSFMVSSTLWQISRYHRRENEDGLYTFRCLFLPSRLFCQIKQKCKLL